MKSYIQIAIRTKTETIDWGVGEKLIDSLGVSGGALLPEQVSHNADKLLRLSWGRLRVRVFGPLQRQYALMALCRTFTKILHGEEKSRSNRREVWFIHLAIFEGK